MLAVFVAVLGTTGYLYMIVPKGFIPDTDNDNFNVNIEAAQGTSFYQMVKYQQMVSAILVQDPDIETFYSSTGGMGGFGGAGEHRPHDGQPEAAPAARGIGDATSSTGCVRRSPNFPGLRVFMSVPQAIRVGGRMQKSGYDFTLYGPDTEQLYAEAPKLERVLARMPGLHGCFERPADQELRGSTSFWTATGRRLWG